MSRIVEKVRGKGHPNIRATHPSTLAATVDPEVSVAGDCFLMVSADKSPSTLSEDFKNAARRRVKILGRIIVGGLEDLFECYGDPSLPFEDTRTMVFRKSRYVCSKTVGIESSKSARDIDRRIVKMLRKGAEALIELTVLE
ncbi:MAG: DUF371 domain-containing protein [Candidatus Brockarchaeota archaeon]|nr:DUF371 domain-containing protein [Candidatus Brockarchaeota archaeon]MBO3808354.1 DUF371 domain-containing protein [Candidatus Brockarchaeota archaeon]MBO3842070.1 DUF371 domain-containing protein [Candidatus Brockarchaeota archaeon]